MSDHPRLRGPDLTDLRRRVRRRRVQHAMFTAALTAAVVTGAVLVVPRSAATSGRPSLVGGSEPTPVRSTDASESASGPAAAVTTFIAQGGRYCVAGDLHAVVSVGEQTGGLVTATVAVGNSSATLCALAGPLSFVGLSARGAALTAVSSCPDAAASPSNCPAPAILPPVAAGDIDPFFAPARFAMVQIAGFYRDDPQGSANGLCATADEVTPAVLRLAFGDQLVDVPNRATSGSAGPGLQLSVSGCRGLIGLANSNLATPTASSEVSAPAVGGTASASS